MRIALLGTPLLYSSAHSKTRRRCYDLQVMPQISIHPLGLLKSRREAQHLEVTFEMLLQLRDFLTKQYWQHKSEPIEASLGLFLKFAPESQIAPSVSFRWGLAFINLAILCDVALITCLKMGSSWHTKLTHHR